MLYLFFGEDTFRSRDRLRGFLEDASFGKDRLFSISWLDADVFTKTAFEEFLRLENLFGGNRVVVCEKLFRETDADFLAKNLQACASSPNIFLFWEEDLDSRYFPAFKKYAQKIEEFKPLSLGQVRIWLEKEARKRKIALPVSHREELIRQCKDNLWLLSQELEKYALAPRPISLKDQRIETVEINPFKITDAVAERNKNRAWFLFQKALLSGIDPEEIFWKIIWQIKNLLLIKKLSPAPEKKIAETTHLHPFVVKKTLPAVKNFTEEELANYSSELIGLYHNSRRGLADFETGIEKFLIQI